MLYVLLTGALPFAKRGDERANNLVRLQQMFPRIVAADYEVPGHVSPGCAHLLGRMLTADPGARVTLPEIGQHPWFLANLSPEIARLNAALVSALVPAGLQGVAEIEAIVRAATRAEAPPPPLASAGSEALLASAGSGMLLASMGSGALPATSW